MIVVADTSPLRYLVVIGEVEIQHALYGFIFVPPAVMLELTQEHTPLEVRRWITEPPEWLRVHIPIGSFFPPFPATLGAGECGAIAIAGEISADLLMIDDGPGRR